MFTRSEVRHACFRAKKKADNEKHKEVLDLVKSKLPEGYRFENFAELWDVMVTGGNITIVQPESDYDFIHETCTEAAVMARLGKDFSAMTARQQNVIAVVENEMLDGLTVWKEYNRKWGVTLDTELKKIKIKLFSVKPSQLEVTDEMITSSMKDADGSALTIEQVNALEAKPMDEKQRAMFEEFLAKRNKPV